MTNTLKARTYNPKPVNNYTMTRGLWSSQFNGEPWTIMKFPPSNFTPNHNTFWENYLHNVLKEASQRRKVRFGQIIREGDFQAPSFPFLICLSGVTPFPILLHSGPPILLHPGPPCCRSGHPHLSGVDSSRPASSPHQVI